MAPLATPCSAGVVVVAARTMMLVSTTCTGHLVGPLAAHSVDDVADFLDAQVRCIVRRHRELDAVPGFPTDFRLSWCDLDGALMEAKVDAGAWSEASSLAKGFRDHKTAGGVDGCGHGTKIPTKMAESFCA